MHRAHENAVLEGDMTQIKRSEEGGVLGHEGLRRGSCQCEDRRSVGGQRSDFRGQNNRLMPGATGEVTTVQVMMGCPKRCCPFKLAG